MKNSQRIFILAFSFAALFFLSTGAFAADPIPGVDVHLGKNPGGSQLTTQTDNNGKFEFANAEAGSYTITFSEKQMPFQLQLNVKSQGSDKPSVTVDGREWDSSKPIEVNAQRKIMVISVSHGITITGKVSKFAIKENGVK